MTLHILVEGRSEVAFFEPWAKRLLPGHAIKVHPHQGKGSLPKPTEQPDPRRRGLLCQLPQKLRALGKAPTSSSDSVLVVVDADKEDCVALKKAQVALVDAMEPRPKVLFRIAVEELEAFYLGDLAGLKRAFPEHDAKLARAFTPDSVCGTAEYFGRVIGDGGLNKVHWAEVLGPKLTIAAQRSRSPSFRALVTGLLRFTAGAPKPEPKRAWRHVAKSKKGGVRR